MKIICVRGCSIRAFFSAHKAPVNKWCCLGCAADSWSWASRASQGPETPSPPSVHSRMNEEAARVMLRGVAFALFPLRRSKEMHRQQGSDQTMSSAAGRTGPGSPSTTKSSSVHSHPWMHWPSQPCDTSTGSVNILHSHAVKTVSRRGEGVCSCHNVMTPGMAVSASLPRCHSGDTARPSALLGDL